MQRACVCVCAGGLVVGYGRVYIFMYMCECRYIYTCAYMCV